MYKKTTLWAIFFALLFILFEGFSSTFIFYYYMYRGEDSPRVYYKDSPTASWFLIRKAMDISGIYQFKTGGSYTKSSPDPFFVKDDLLGWGVHPGTYDLDFFSLSKSPNIFRWRATVLRDGSRATSHQKINANIPEIFLFGDSQIFGWGVNDEHTMAWLLQSFFGNLKRVKNFSHGGYGTVHNYLELLRRKNEIDKGDVLIFGYADYFHERNVADPDWLKTISAQPVTSKSEDRANVHPRAFHGEKGELKIDYVDINCSKMAAKCQNSKVSKNEQALVTRSLFYKIISLTNAQIIILHISGIDDDPVINYLRKRDVQIVDVRKNNKNYLEWDNIYGYDKHPGALTHYHWYRKLVSALSDID